MKQDQNKPQGGWGGKPQQQGGKTQPGQTNPGQRQGGFDPNKGRDTGTTGK